MAQRIIGPAGAPGLPGPEAAARRPDTLWSRRDFFSITGWAGLAAVTAAGTLAFTRFMFPRVLFEPDPTFNAGRPEEYVVGVVDERWKLAKRVWVVRTPERIYALQAICTHLGCTPNWLNAEDKFKCPCHGSGFRRSGVNFEGPAPRPLERLKVALAPDGQLVVDRGVRFRDEKGEWDKPGAFLKV